MMTQIYKVGVSEERQNIICAIQGNGKTIKH